MARSARQGSGRFGGTRRWVFADVVFDEAEWSVSVGGQRVAIEQKPMELLHELLMAKGRVVSKDGLLARAWSDVIVVEASLPTAIGKLRKAIGDTDRSRPLIETVSKVGYRLAVPVSVAVQDRRRREDRVPQSDLRPQERTVLRRRWVLASGIAIAATASGLALGAFDQPVAKAPAPAVNRAEVLNAVRRLDIDKVDALIAGGLNPNATLDQVGSTPITVALEVCEWNPGHDREKLMLIVRSLLDAGTRLDQRNVFGDTPYSIARAKRYCGPDHPATVLIRKMCVSGATSIIDDRCLALRNGVLER